LTRLPNHDDKAHLEPQRTPSPRPLRPLASLLAHPRIALAAMVLVIAAGIPYAWVKGKSTYVAQALLQVAPRYMKNLRDDQELDFQSNSQYRQFVQQQIETLRRHDVMLAAVARIDEAGGQWRQAHETPRTAAERLQRAIGLAAVPDSYLISVSIDGDGPAGLAKIVNAVTAAYLEVAQQEQLFGSAKRRENLQTRHAAIAAELEARTKRRQELARKLGVSTFVETDLNPFDKLYVDARGALAEAKRRRFDAESRLAAFAKNNAVEPALQSPRDLVALDPGLNALKTNLYKRRADLTSATSGLADAHPAAVGAREEVAEIDAEVAGHTRIVSAEASGAVRAKLVAAVAEARDVEAQLEQEAERQRLNSGERAALYGDGLELTAEIAALRKELDRIADRQNFFDVEANAPGFAFIATPALDPELPASGGRRKLLLLVLAAALGAGLAAPMARDLLARRILTARDVAHILGFAPLGWTAAPDAPGAAAFNHHQLRRVAGGLLRERDRHDSRAILFAGARSDAATTTTVFALARILAELGVRSIVVSTRDDGTDLRYRTQRPGLADVLDGHATATEAIVPRAGDLPARMRSAAEPDGLGSLRRLPDVLATLALDHDLILLDGPSILTTADAELLAAGVCAVTLVADARTDLCRDVRRAADRLSLLAPRSVGAVVIDVDPGRAGGQGPELAAEIAGRAPSLSTLAQTAFRQLAQWKTA
jgi:succinoglycan biosynthesis transport protein ExoP